LVDPSRIVVQLRDRNVSGQALESAARALVGLTSARIVVNDSVDLARRLGLGVHLRESSVEVHEARAALGPQALIGASCHDLAGIHRRRACDYVTLGPVAAVPDKGEPISNIEIRELCVAAKCPVFLLGGVDEAWASRARALGARGVAIMREVSRAEDPATVASRYLERLSEGARA
jgi:thiamine-phosphate pyrophosphorylase